MIPKGDLQKEDMIGYGWTALMTASFHGHGSVVQVLVEKGSKINMRSADGWTPMVCACRYGHELVVEMLVKKDHDSISAAGKADYGTNKFPSHFRLLIGLRSFITMERNMLKTGRSY